MDIPQELAGVRVGRDFIELPKPLADKIAKFVATAHMLLNHPDGGEMYMQEMGIWLNDPQIREWTKWMCWRALKEEGKE